MAGWRSPLGETWFMRSRQQSWIWQPVQSPNVRSWVFRGRWEARARVALREVGEGGKAKAEGLEDQGKTWVLFQVCWRALESGTQRNNMMGSLYF